MLFRSVANESMGREDVLKFWFGESDEVTPELVREAAIASLQTGETFYAQNLGLIELRQASPWPSRTAVCTLFSGWKVARIASARPSVWCAKPASAGRRAVPLLRKQQDGCAGVLPAGIPSDWCKACSA